MVSYSHKPGLLYHFTTKFHQFNYLPKNGRVCVVLFIAIFMLYILNVLNNNISLTVKIVKTAKEFEVPVML